MNDAAVRGLIERALAEDIGAGDRTSEALIPVGLRGRAVMLAKSAGILCGVAVAGRVFAEVDPAVSFEVVLGDGERVAGEREAVSRIAGSLRSILAAERTALNFVQRMSGVASAASRFAEAVAGTRAQIVDTRKTIPGLRDLDKYAAATGGVRNHRFGLFDGILIKDNHIAAVGTIVECVARARRAAPHTLRVEVEAATVAQAREAAQSGADIVLLDNMSLEDLAESVRAIGGRALTEASGSVTLATVRRIAETGVDYISVGAITHSASALDISLDIVQDEPR